MTVRTLFVFDEFMNLIRNISFESVPSDFDPFDFLATHSIRLLSDGIVLLYKHLGVGAAFMDRYDNRFVRLWRVFNGL